MNQDIVLKALKEAKEKSPKRNFKQSVDYIVALKGLDLKKPDQQQDFFIQLHHPRSKKVKVCGLVGPELYEQAKEALDKAILVDDFASFKDKKSIKNLANEFDFFVAQANIMALVAKNFGRVFGPRGKMPNPKAGCVVPPNANLKSLYEKLQATVHVKVKNQLQAQFNVGYEDTDEKVVVDNILTIYKQLINHFPQDKNNIKAQYIKLTMGKPVQIGKKSD
jgi:large subunit ribosomal protein L1